MAFTAAASFIGVPDFGKIHINAEEVAKTLQAYLESASRITGVSLDDIDRKVIKLPADPKAVTLVGLLEIGMKLLDALVWLHAKRPDSHPLQADPTMKPAEIPSMQNVARSVFFTHFMLITQARYPASRNTKDKPQVPNFLRTIMGMDKPQDFYIEMICSFEPQQFDPTWIRFVSFKGFGQETRSRLGLGVAGYRLFTPFGLYEPKADMDPALRPAFQFAQNLSKAPASWAVHPLTRDPNILTSRGNLNKNLGNLILDCFTAEQIAAMVKVRVLFKAPERDEGHRNYRTWAADDDITGNQFIFPQ